MVRCRIELVDCEARLLSVVRIREGRGKETVLGHPILCTWGFPTKGQETKMIIRAGVEQAVNIFSMREGEAHPRLETQPQPVDLWRALTEPGTFHLKVGVIAKGFDLEIRSYLFSWASFGSMSLDELP
jgi:hypothetical protein